MTFSKFMMVSSALLVSQFLIESESETYLQEIDWNDTTQAKNKYLAVSPGLSTDAISLTINADITVTHANGKIRSRKVHVVKHNADSLAQYDEIEEQEKRTRINMYKKPWYFEIRQYNDSPYVLHGFMKYDEVRKRPPQALLTGFLFWAGLHYPASTKGTNYVRCQCACSAC